MTPRMRLVNIKANYRQHPDGEAIRDALEQAYAFGHEFGLQRAAEEVITAASRIGALKVTPLTLAKMTEDIDITVSVAQSDVKPQPKKTTIWDRYDKQGNPLGQVEA